MNGLNEKNVIACIFCIIIFCACTADKNRAGNNLSIGSSIDSSTTGSIAAASGSTANVTEAAVKSNNSKKIQTDDIRTLRYANDKNIYLGDGDQKIYQYDLCGRRKKSYDLCKELGEKTDIYLTEVLWVDKDGLFFSCFRGYHDEIWYVPLTRKKNGLKMKEKKKITSLDCFVTKTENEIIYSQASKIYKMDMKTKRRQVLRTDDYIMDCRIMLDRHGTPFVQGNKIYYTDDKDDMYQVDLEDWKPVYIGKKGRLMDCIETEGFNLYYRSQDEYVRYNFQTGKEIPLNISEKIGKEIDGLRETWETFTHKVNWEKGWGVDIETFSYYENRLYLAVKVTGGYDKWEARFMFSCQASDGSDLRFEKEVTEYLWKNSIPYKDENNDEDEVESCDPIIWDLKHVTGEFLYYLDGCIVMHFYDKEAEGDEDAHHRFVVYDISTGTFRKVKKYSKEYGYFKALGLSETDDLVR